MCVGLYQQMYALHCKQTRNRLCGSERSRLCLCTHMYACVYNPGLTRAYVSYIGGQVFKLTYAIVLKNKLIAAYLWAEY